MVRSYALQVLVIAATERELTGVADGVVCGVGPVDAAAVTARALLERRPRAVLNVGLAGAHAFEQPELVLGSESRYCDTDSRLVTAVTAPDPDLLAAARAAFPAARVVPIGTSARVNGTTGCDVEAMEGFAVLRACALAGVPALEARVLSNEISEPDRARWRFDDALAFLHETLPRLLEALDA
jgi:nucleoside phosphorylase